MAKRTSLLVSILLILMMAVGCSPQAMQQQEIDPSSGIWDRFFVFPLSWTLDTAAGWLGGSYGLSIVIVTILVRIVILPLNYRQMKSSKEMQGIQPELAKLQKKYKNDREKLQMETMKLFQKHNINPLMGCLPILIQIPILFAFYSAIVRNEEIRGHTFLWMSLGAPDPLYMLPIIAAITTYAQIRVSRRLMPSPQAGGNPQMQQQQQTMMNMMSFMMPVMILIFAISLPSALALYWVFGNLFSIAQTFLLHKILYSEKTEATA